MTTIPRSAQPTSDTRVLMTLASATFLVDALIVFGVGFGVSPWEHEATAATASILTAALFVVQLTIVGVLARLRRRSRV